MNAFNDDSLVKPLGVVLTGASSEVGSGIAKSLATRALHGLVLTSNETEIASGLTGQENVVVLPRCDLTDPQALLRLREASEQTFNGPFALVHSVGDFWHHKPIPECSLVEAERMMVSHYLTLYGTLNALLPVMVQAGGGRIVAFSCTSVAYSYPEMAAFTSAKAAIETLIRCTANEWAEKNIAANAIALSTVATPSVLSTKPLASEESYITIEEVVELVENLLFDVGRYFSGNVVRPLKHSHTFYDRAYFDRNPRWSV